MTLGSTRLTPLRASTENMQLYDLFRNIWDEHLHPHTSHNKIQLQVISGVKYTIVSVRQLNYIHTLNIDNLN